LNVATKVPGPGRRRVGDSPEMLDPAGAAAEVKVQIRTHPGAPRSGSSLWENFEDPVV
jgi:hypothetical protein